MARRRCVKSGDGGPAGVADRSLDRAPGAGAVDRGDLVEVGRPVADRGVRVGQGAAGRRQLRLAAGRRRAVDGVIGDRRAAVRCRGRPGQADRAVAGGRRVQGRGAGRAGRRGRPLVRQGAGPGAVDRGDLVEVGRPVADRGVRVGQGPAGRRQLRLAAGRRRAVDGVIGDRRAAVRCRGRPGQADRAVAGGRRVQGRGAGRRRRRIRSRRPRRSSGSATARRSRRRCSTGP